MQQKYIIVDDAGGVFDIPILFHQALNHSDMAAKFGGKDNITSAGIMMIDDAGEVFVNVGSTSLGIKPSPEEREEATERDLVLVKRSLTFNA